MVSKITAIFFIVLFWILTVGILLLPEIFAPIIAILLIVAVVVGVSYGAYCLLRFGSES